MFNNAILQSGTPFLNSLTAVSREEATRRSREVINLIGCANETSLDSEIALCVQNSQHIAQAAFDYFKKITKGNRFLGLNVINPFSPVIDGRVLIDSPKTLFARGEFKKCPVIIGYLIDDGSMFAGYSAEVSSLNL